MGPLDDFFGNDFIVRAPVPATVNRGAANYKSEVGHVEYYPRRAYAEWLGILEAIRELGGDAILMLEPEDEPYLGIEALVLDGDGLVRPLGSTEILEPIDRVMTGRVYAANGPWIVRRDRVLRAVLPNMLEHRRTENAYFELLLWKIAEALDLDLSTTRNPHRWEGLADVAVIGDRAILTYTVRGRYDRGLTEQVLRSSRAGVEFAADHVKLMRSKRIYAELVHPHFHGDTVQFTVRAAGGRHVLHQFAGGLLDDDAARIEETLSEEIRPIGAEDARSAFAANSRQVGRGVLIPGGASLELRRSIESLGVTARPVDVSELFGKGGGGPACATLQLPRNLVVPERSPLRYSVSRRAIVDRLERIPSRLLVASEFSAGWSGGEAALSSRRPSQRRP
jgi:N-dimethylarginine dimethylaminohydrolase